MSTAQLSKDTEDRLVRVLERLAADFMDYRLLTGIINDLGLPDWSIEQTMREVADALGFEGSGYEDPDTFVLHQQTVQGFTSSDLLLKIRGYLRANAGQR